MSEPICCPCQRKKERGEDEKKLLLNRLSRIEGQIRGIRAMVEKDAYCPDILTQASAASAALMAPKFVSKMLPSFLSFPPSALFSSRPHPHEHRLGINKAPAAQQSIYASAVNRRRVLSVAQTKGLGLGINPV